MAHTTTARAAFRYLGVTDDCTTCEDCGKPELRSTVVIQPLADDGSDDGEPCYYGSTCAARALAAPGEKLTGRTVTASARYAHHHTLTDAADARRALTRYGLPLDGDPTHDELRAAVRVYVATNNGVAARVQATGVKVPGMVLEMLTRRRATIAAAALVNPVCSYCHHTH